MHTRYSCIRRRCALYFSTVKVGEVRYARNEALRAVPCATAYSTTLLFALLETVILSLVFVSVLFAASSSTVATLTHLHPIFLPFLDCSILRGRCAFEQVSFENEWNNKWIKRVRQRSVRWKYNQYFHVMYFVHHIEWLFFYVFISASDSKSDTIWYAPYVLFAHIWWQNYKMIWISLLVAFR